MTCKKSNLLSLSFLVFLFVGSSSFVCGEDRCKECEEWGFCICDVLLPQPHDINKSDEGKEYRTKLKSIQAPFEHANGFIWSNEKRKKISGSSTDIKNENFDFSLFRGYFNPDPDEYVGRLAFYSCSFYGATFGKSIFYDWYFHGCDFRFANFDNAEFYSGIIDDNCLFKGAKINGSRLNLSQEQFLSTDPFMKEVTTPYYKNSVIRDRVLLKNFVLDIKNHPYTKDFEGLGNKLHDIDFNKFYDGDKVKKATLPCIIRNCVFARSFINCNFTGGELEQTTFRGCYFNPPNKEPPLKITEFVFLKVEDCDFSSTKLKDVDFTIMSLKGSVFDDAEIYGVNFAGNAIFFDPQKFDSKGNELTAKEIIEHDNNEWATWKKWKKEEISWMMKNGLQKEQLTQTASFKKKKLLNIKFCMNMSKLNLSGFNLTGCKFSGDLTDVNFTDAVITDCVFGWGTNLTNKQIRSTWNWKHGQMDNIKLPLDID